MNKIARGSLVLTLVAALGLLAGCQTPAQQAATDEAACASMGAPLGHPDYSSCRISLTLKRTAESQERTQRLYSAAAALSGSGGGADPDRTAPQPTLTCFKRNEVTSGMNKICYYDCLGSTVAHNIGTVELCPLTIRR